MALLWAQLAGMTWFQAGSAVAFGALVALAAQHVMRRYIHRAVHREWHGAVVTLTETLATHEGRLAEQLDRLERLRADQVLTEARVHKALKILDDLRGAR